MKTMLFQSILNVCRSVSEDNSAVQHNSSEVLIWLRCTVEHLAPATNIKCSFIATLEASDLT